MNQQRPDVGTGYGRDVAQTALASVAATAAAGLAGVLIARALGVSARGEYAAITAWFGTLLIVGQVGLTAATTYFVARHPERAADHVATARRLMTLTGTIAFALGILLAPLLAQGNPQTTGGYRLMFAAGLAVFVGASFTSGLQAINMSRWNLVRAAQPVLMLGAVLALGLAGRLSLRTTLIALAAAIASQTAVAYWLCRRPGLTRGSADLRLTGPMARYGVGQFSATVPALMVARLDQLVLSMTVGPAVLGRYAVAASLTTLSMPLVTAMGYVAFPRLASPTLSRTDQARLRRWSLVAGAVVSSAATLVVAVSARWLVPALFGPAFAGSVSLIWLLAPAGVFLGCGQVCGDLLRGHGRPFAVARAQWVAAVATAVLLAALLPVLGAYAAAITTSVASGLALVLMVLALRSATRAGPAGSPVLAGPSTMEA